VGGMGVWEFFPNLFFICVFCFLLFVVFFGSNHFVISFVFYLL